MVRAVVEGDRALLRQISTYLQGLGIPVDDWSYRSMPPHAAWGLIQHTCRCDLVLVPVAMTGAPNRIALQRITDVDGIQVIQEVVGANVVIKYRVIGRNFDPSVSEIVAQIMQLSRIRPPAYAIDSQLFLPSILGSRGVYVIYPVSVLGSLLRSLGARVKFLNYTGGEISDSKGAKIFVGVPANVGAGWELWKRGYFVLNGEVDERYFKQRKADVGEMSVMRDLISAGCSASSVRVGDNSFYDLVNGLVPPKALGQPEAGDQSYPTLIVVGGKGSGKTPAVCALRAASIETFDSDDYLDAKTAASSREEFILIMKSNQGKTGMDLTTKKAIDDWYLRRCALIRESVIEKYKYGKRQAFFFHNMAEMLSCHAFIDYQVVVLDVSMQYALNNVRLRSRDIEFELPFATYTWDHFVVPANATRVLPVSMVRVCLAMALMPKVGVMKEPGGDEALPNA